MRYRSIAVMFSAGVLASSALLSARNAACLAPSSIFEQSDRRPAGKGTGEQSTAAERAVNELIGNAQRLFLDEASRGALTGDIALALGQAFDVILVSAPGEIGRLDDPGPVIDMLMYLEESQKPYAPGWVAVMRESLIACGEPGNRVALSDILRARMEKAPALHMRAQELHHMLKNSVFNYFELRQMTLQEALDFAEVSLFYADWVERMRRVTAAQILTIPDETLADYFKRYLAGIRTVEEKAAEKSDAAKLPDSDLFLRLQETVRMKGVIAGRWHDYLEIYKIKMRDGYDKGLESPARTTREWQESFERYPGIEMFYERSMAALFGPLQEEESRLKKELLARIGKDPAIVRGIVRAANERSAHILDPVMDWLLTLRVGATESEIDWERVVKRFGDEQFIYEGTPYNLIRDFIARLGLGPSDVFYDLGCGYGRIIFFTRLATDVGLVKGVEIVPERVEECERVKKRFGIGRMEIVAQNIRDVDLRDGSVFFLFNPFIAGTLDNVSLKLYDAARLRKIMIASYGACTYYFEDQASWLKPLFSSYYNGAKVSLFESTLEISDAALSTGADAIDRSVSTDGLVTASH